MRRPGLTLPIVLAAALQLSRGVMTCKQIKVTKHEQDIARSSVGVEPEAWFLNDRVIFMGDMGARTLWRLWRASIHAPHLCRGWPYAENRGVLGTWSCRLASCPGALRRLLYSTTLEQTALNPQRSSMSPTSVGLNVFA
jgi:hypothetical protein